MDIPRGRAGASEGARVGLSHADASAAQFAHSDAFVASLPATIDGGGLRVLALGAVDARPTYHAFKVRGRAAARRAAKVARARARLRALRGVVVYAPPHPPFPPRLLSPP